MIVCTVLQVFFQNEFLEVPKIYLPPLYNQFAPQGPHSHILLMGGGGGVRGIFLGLKFWPKKIFGVYERQGFFWVVKKTTDFFGYCTYHQLKSTIR